VPVWRIPATAVAMPVVFVAGWFICQWVWWLFGRIYDALSPIIGPLGYDPKNIAFPQQLFRNLVPAAVAMLCTAWVASKVLRGGRIGYRLGAGIILVGLVAIAAFTTWAVTSGNAAMTWRDIVLHWATVGVVAWIAQGLENTD
jgi:hypothetical protein